LPNEQRNSEETQTASIHNESTFQNADDQVSDDERKHSLGFEKMEERTSITLCVL
jgi:hypothetical protein